MKKLVIGLTGGIASGKSTVGKIFTSLGVTVIDADQLSRDAVAPGTSGLAELVGLFGAEYLTPEGILDRAKLGVLVFREPSARKALEAITHPRIRQLYEERVQEARNTTTPYILYEAALLVELGLYAGMDKLIVVAANPELQTTRVMKRNGITEEEARSRIASQYPLAKKLDVADYVIFNDNNREALQVRTLDVHEQILTLSILP